MSFSPFVSINLRSFKVIKDFTHLIHNVQVIKNIWVQLEGMLCYAKSLQSCPTLCDPIDGSLSGSPVPGILQARTLEWVAISFSNAWKWKVKSESEVAQSCPTLSDPMDCSLPGSFIHGIFRARVLEWGAIAFSIRRYESQKIKFYGSYITNQLHKQRAQKLNRVDKSVSLRKV